MLHYVTKEAFTIASDLNFGDWNKQQAFLDKLPGNREHHLFQYFSTPYHNPKLQGRYIPFPGPSGVKQFADLTRKVYSTFLPVAQKANSSARRIFQSAKNSYQQDRTLWSRPIKQTPKHYYPESSLQGSLLKEHLRQGEKYGISNIKFLENGKIRYYGQIELSNNPGNMVGRRMTREWDPLTGKKRTWHETMDKNGKTRIVRPEALNKKKTHYLFDEYGNYVGKK